MTQWLVEEAAFVALELSDARVEVLAAEEQAREQRLLESAHRQFQGGRR